MKKTAKAIAEPKNELPTCPKCLKQVPLMEDGLCVECSEEKAKADAAYKEQCDMLMKYVERRVGPGGGSMRIYITIPGEPKAKGRPKFYRSGKFVRAVTPEMTVKYEQHVKNCAMLQAQGQMLHGPLYARIAFFFDLPKSKWKKREPVKRQWHIGKPDWDNLGKAVCDSLNGICYKDDSEICCVRVVKVTEAQGGPPARCVLYIEELPELEQCETSKWLDQIPSAT